MRFRITKNPRVALVLIPYFVPFTQSREEIYLELRHQLTYKPEETFVCIAIEGDSFKGMTIAYCRDKDVLITQARTVKGVPRAVVDHAFAGIAHWAKGKGFNRITGFPNRAGKIWVRRWGFQQSEENKEEVYLNI